MGLCVQYVLLCTFVCVPMCLSLPVLSWNPICDSITPNRYRRTHLFSWISVYPVEIMAIYTAMIFQLWEIKCKSMQRGGLVKFGNWWSKFLNFFYDIYSKMQWLWDYFSLFPEKWTNRYLDTLTFLCLFLFIWLMTIAEG